MALVFAIAAMSAVLVSAGGCGRSFDSRLQAITRPYRFSIAFWEFKAIPGQIGQWLFVKPKPVDNEVGTVTDYFSLTERINRLQSMIEAVKAGNQAGDLASLQADVDKLLKQRTALDPTVTGLLARQIRATLNQQGIYSPADRYVKLPVNFPPLAFKLTVPPHELIVSPRDRIETIRRMTLQPNMDVRQMESVEEQADKLGVSSLVVDLGGLGTYPSFVTDDADLRFTAETIAHEWTHQYLAFTPLGIRYVFDVMGVVQNYDIATMNETVADMVGKEISDIVYQKYYPGQGAPPKPAPAFDFNAAMRDIRRAVDQYLAKGDIDQAEAFMEQQRQFLASKGYYIRKLNQAYFAFHGTYADSPTSISPIGVELRELRRKSVSLKDFLDTAAVMTSRQDLQLILQKGSAGS